MQIATLCFLLEGEGIWLGTQLRGLFKGALNGPGGKVEDGESIIDCLVRETYEELEVILLGELRQCARITAYVGDVQPFLDVHVFMSTAWYGTPKATKEMEAPKIHYALPFDRLVAGTEVWLPLVLTGQKLDVELFLSADAKNAEEIRIRKASFL